MEAYGRGVGAERVDLDRLEACRDMRRPQILAGILTDDLQDGEVTAALERPE